MWIHFTLATLFVLSCAWFCFGQEISYTGDSLGSIKQLVESNEAILLDVREQIEWDECHAKLAVFLPMSILKDDTQRAAALESLDKSKPIYCHCKVGGRAMVFAEMVQGMGFDVRPMRYKFTMIEKCGLEMIEANVAP
jgi:phage shock protein E